MSFLFEDLKVYQKAMDLTKDLLRFMELVPRGNSALLDQLRRAAISIPTNIAEGSGRWHINDRKQFFWIARGSANECFVLMELCLYQGLIDESLMKDIKHRLEEITRMLTALIASLKEQK